MSKKATEFQKREMSKMYRGKEIFKPLNTGWVDERVACVREWVANIFFYRKGDPLLCRGQRPAGGQQEQDREFFHRIFLLILFRLHVGQKYKKYAESGEPRCKVGA